MHYPIYIVYIHYSYIYIYIYLYMYVCSMYVYMFICDFLWVWKNVLMSILILRVINVNVFLVRTAAA